MPFSPFLQLVEKELQRSDLHFKKMKVELECEWVKHNCKYSYSVTRTASSSTLLYIACLTICKNSLCKNVSKCWKRNGKGHYAKKCPRYCLVICNNFI